MKTQSVHEVTISEILTTQFTNAKTSEISGVIVYEGFHDGYGRNIVLIALNNGRGILIVE